MRRRKPTHPVEQKRKELGLTGAALAKRVEISPSHLLRIERREIESPSVDLALKLADALGVDVRELFDVHEVATR